MYQRFNRSSFNIEKAVCSNWCVLTDTVEKAVDFVTFMLESGYKWISGDMRYRNVYKFDKENTCFFLDRGAESVDHYSVMSWGNKYHNDAILIGKRYYMVEWEVL